LVTEPLPRYLEMSEAINHNTRNIRQTSRKRVSRTVMEEKTEIIAFPIPPKEQVYDDVFLYTKELQKQFFDKRFKIYTATKGKVTLPRYFQHLYWKNNRSPQEFDASLQEIKTFLTQSGFTPTALNFHLYKNEKMPSLYVYVKRYSNANVIGLYLMRYYNGNTPTFLDLL
jgi:hypothetical protein